MLRILLLALAVLAAPVAAQEAAAPGPVQALLAPHRAAIESGQRKQVEPALSALADTGEPGLAPVLEAWADRRLWVAAATGVFVIAEEAGDDLQITDIDTGATATAPKADFAQLRPNSGIRGLIAVALVRFQLADPHPARRAAALDAIARSGRATELAPLRAAAPDPDPALEIRRDRLDRLLTLRFDPDPAARIAAIESFAGDLGVDVRAALNPLLATARKVYPADAVPEGLNTAATLAPGDDLTREAAYDLLAEAGLAPARTDAATRDAALSAAVADGAVAGLPVATLDSRAARDAAYGALAATGAAPPMVTEADIAAALAAHAIVDVFIEADPAITDAAQAALDAIAAKLALNQAADLALDALSLASIYFLAAIGLAITFGVMGVINMAHGEFIMMGAYTGYVVQLFVPDYTLSILVALPLAFAVTFAAGVALERLVVRWLYHRPLETLLATFGISIALQQLAKTIFGTQARPLTAPGWLDGSLVINDVVAISYIRIAIFVLALVFLGLYLFVMRRTRLGLEVRAVTQNPRMAASMGINPDRINMLAFGLGSGIAGIAGVAIGLFAKVTSELGSDYIVQSFMTVVVGGVGNIWGTLAGATLIGFLQKGIEWFNPSNTLAAQTYMILFIIVFIQFRPRGIIALRGRAAGD